MLRFVLPVTLLFAIAIGYFIFQYNLNINASLKADYQRQIDRHQEIIHGYQINSDVTFENLVMQKDVLSILNQAQNTSKDQFIQLHNQLHALLANKYESLKKIAKIRQLHFHMPDGRSFLRMHRPGKFGDLLFDFRYSVKKANIEKKRSHGFEEGRIFNGYRFVYPIIDHNQHLGSVEISLSMKAFTDSLSKVYEGTYCFMLDANIVGEKVFADEKSNYRQSPFGEHYAMDKKVDNELCTRLNPHIDELSTNDDLLIHLKSFKPFSEMIGGFFRFDGFISHFVPLQNIEQETVAYLFSVQRNEEITSLRNRFIYNLMLSILVFIATVVAIIALNKRHQELKTHAEELKTTVLDLTENYENLMKEQTYIKGLLETIFNVIDHLNRLGKVDKLLYASCENLMHYDNYRFVHIHTFNNQINVDISQIAQKDGLKTPELKEFYENIEQEASIQTVLKHGELITVDNVQNKDFAQPIIDYLQSREISHATFLPIQNKDSHTYGFMILLTTQEQIPEERTLLKKLGTTISQSVTTLNRRDTYEHQLLEKTKNYKFILFEIVDLLEKRHVLTAGRSIRVSKYSKKIATALNLDAKNIATLVDAAMLHDIGNIKIPDNILLKAGMLTPQERNMVENHVMYGAKLFERLPGFQQIYETILHHHEYFDGSGYPNGISGEEIPLLSRIIAVADAFEAMTSCWIYKPSIPANKAISELEKHKGSQFDPVIVNIASHVLKDEPLDHLKRSLPTSGTELQRLQYLLCDENTGLFDVRYLDMLALSEFRGMKIEAMQIVTIASLLEQTHQQHSETMNMLGKIFKKFYTNDLSFFVEPNYLILIHLESYDENLQSALLQRLESDKHIHLDIETIVTDNLKEHLQKLQPILASARQRQ